MLKVALTNLADYTNGILNYEWVELPADESDIESAFERLHIDESTEYFISDYETDSGIKIGEYENIYDLNESVERLDDLDEYDRVIADALLEYGYGDLDEILDIIDDCRVYDDCYNMSDVAYEVVNECGYLDNAPEMLQSYFDYESFGRDLDIKGTFIYAGGGVYVEVCR